MGTCYNSTVIDLPIEKAWQLIRNFHDLSWAAPVITSCDPIGDKPGTDPGARRMVNELFAETLVSIDDAQYTFSYSLDDGPEPLSKDTLTSYIGTVHLYPVTDTDATFVQWTAHYASADDNAVAGFCNAIYVNLLAALKANCKK